MDSWNDLEDKTPKTVDNYIVLIEGLGDHSTQRESKANWGGNEFTLEHEDLESHEYISKWKPNQTKH